MAQMMSANSALPTAGLDRLLAFTIAGRDSRGRILRLGPVLDEILGAHAYPPVIAQCLAEALVITGLMGGLLKGEDDQLTIQAQSEGGPIKLLVCDYRRGELRGYVEQEAGVALPPAEDARLETLFGAGYLAITFDIASSGQRYQGIVPLEGASLAAALEGYFAQSEQVPTLIRVAMLAKGEGHVAGGLLIQHLPEGEDGRERLHARMDHPHWEHVAILAGSVKPTELADAALPLEDVLWRLFHEEEAVRVVPGAAISRGCRCSVLHFEQVLARFSKDDRREMADADGIITVDCAFCAKAFAIQD